MACLGPLRRGLLLNAPAAWAAEAIAALGFLCNLAALAGRSGQETCNLLLETLKRYQSDASQSDEIPLVAIHAVKRG